VSAETKRAGSLRLVLIGDGESPHLLKWARALVAHPDIDLWAASSRGFAPGFDAAVPTEHRLALGTRPSAAGGNVGLLRSLPRLGRWLRDVDADWLYAHYLTSHGTLAWAARRGWRLRARIAGSAWGSDILATPERSAIYSWLTRQVLRACAVTTSDSQHMAERMRELGAAEVMTFPFGLEAMPPKPAGKDEWLFFANRGLEPIYRPERVLAVFADIAARQPAARLVVANDGSLASELPQAARAMGLRVGTLAAGDQVEFTGRLDATAQAAWYAKARWYLSLPASDSVSVSVLEAMAHGCIPLLSDLPANRELVRDEVNGRLLHEEGCIDVRRPVSAARLERPAADLADSLAALAGSAERIADANRAWIAEHAMFAPAVERFVERLRQAGR
jgi:glycosyltransferase involved in cell wall biosynthesis